MIQTQTRASWIIGNLYMVTIRQECNIRAHRRYKNMEGKEVGRPARASQPTFHPIHVVSLSPKRTQLFMARLATVLKHEEKRRLEQRTLFEQHFSSLEKMERAGERCSHFECSCSLFCLTYDDVSLSFFCSKLLIVSLFGLRNCFTFSFLVDHNFVSSAVS